MQPSNVLDGIRVLDFTWFAPGPCATAALVYMGAEVIRVETMDRQMTRYPGVRTRPSGANVDGGFWSLNVGKRCVRLNLAHPQAMPLVHSLISISDVLAESWRPGVLEEHGLSYQEVIKIKPDIIVFSSSAAGRDGPLWEMRGYAPIFDAMGGLPSVTGWQDGPPGNLGTSIDFRLGRANALALVAALAGQLLSGRGERIDNAGMEVVASLIPEALMDYTLNGHVMGRTGNQDEAHLLQNCYPCKGDEKWVSIVVATEEEWRAFCHAVGHPEWLTDGRLKDAPGRRANQRELDEAVGRWTRDYTHYEVMAKLQAVGVAAVPSFNNKELFTDTHVRERQVWQPVHEVGWDNWHVMPPWKLSETPPQIYGHSPDIGEHEEYVYGEVLGLTTRAIKELRDAKVIH